MKILVMGLPGSGKSTLSKKLFELLPNSVWLNADRIRHSYNDWDFTLEGRIRQAKRMEILSNLCDEDFVIMDFVCPLEVCRLQITTDITIWMDTAKTSMYPDTDCIFEIPKYYNYKITEKDAERYSKLIYEELSSTKSNSF